jgi:hypothetical protein
MHRIRSGIVGSVLAVVIAGCGESTVDEGPKGFTPTDTRQLDPMVKEMQNVMKKGDYTNRPDVPSEKGKSKESEKKK